MTNPLLAFSLRLPFSSIRPEHLEPAIDQCIADAEKLLASLPTAPRTYAGVMLTLEDVTSKLSLVSNIADHLESVATTPEWRSEYEKIEPKVAAFFSSIALREDVYAAVNEYSQTHEAKNLPADKARLLAKSLRQFKRHGAELNPGDKAKLHALEVTLTQKTTKFSQNVLDSTNAYELYLDENQVDGLPESARQAARADAERKEKAGYRFTLQAPSYMPLMTYLKDRGVREQVWRAYNTRAASGATDNRELLLEILKLRKQKANLVGYENFASFVLDERMAHRPETVRAFLNTLTDKTQPAAQREHADLCAFAESLGHTGKVEPWDVAYYSEKLRMERFDFDEEELRPYFPVEQVLDGVFSLAHSLFGIDIVKADAEGWDKDVRFFEMRDKGELIATFYVDLHPRENKRGGAWMNSFINGAASWARNSDGSRGTHSGLFCGNFTKPLGDRPALLTHSEVETLLHEFGHLLHHALSTVEVESLGGTQVSWDFVELPSQIMENFGWERVSVDKFARHIDSGERIPDDLFEKMLRARTYRAAAAQMRQLGFGAVDIELHLALNPDTATIDEVMQLCRKVLGEHAPTELPEDYAMICGFTHLFGSPVGYASGYYSYKWAEVLDADAFSRFAAAGVINADIGHSFREEILSKGDSRDPAELFRSFMGRDPDMNALLRRAGLLTNATL